MASLRFSYDHQRRQERRPPMPYFPRFNRFIPPPAYAKVEDISPSPERTILSAGNVTDDAERSRNEGGKDAGGKAAAGLETSYTDNSGMKAPQETVEKEYGETMNENAGAASLDEPVVSPDPPEPLPAGFSATEGSTPKEEQVLSLSELFIQKLDSAENGLVKTKATVEKAKTLFDDILFQMSNIMQIIEIIKSSEERALSGSQAATASLKTEKDNIDEILELLQNPAVQGMLRQTLLSFMVRR